MAVEKEVLVENVSVENPVLNLNQFNKYCKWAVEVVLKFNGQTPDTTIAKERVCSGHNGNLVAYCYAESGILLAKTDLGS